jgi:hypothetical protein
LTLDRTGPIRTQLAPANWNKWASNVMAAEREAMIDAIAMKPPAIPVSLTGAARGW